MNKTIEVISSDILKNKTLSDKKLYVIEGEVRVRKGVTLTVRDKVTILLVNGVFSKSVVRRSALIFAQGSALFAKRFYVKACSAKHKPVKSADNGGIWFLGNYKDASKDNVSVKVDRKNGLSSFTESSVTTHYLGRKEPYNSAKTGSQLGMGDDVDGFSVLGVSPQEWNISSVRTFYSADDGIDVTNSHIKLDRLEVRHPVEDGMNISSSRVEIHKSLLLDVTKTSETDRDLFDLETDDGASFVELYSRCWVRIKGVFGDQVVLSSGDMPRPNTKDDNEVPYVFEGQLKKASLIYSIDSD
jgi:uncharacterized membrane protein YgdD (TMEM256/DUF423 family)